MRVNMLEAKNQLSKLVKEAMAGEDVVIASNGKPLVRLVPIMKKGGLRRAGRPEEARAAIDQAFTPEVDARSRSSSWGADAAVARHTRRPLVVDR